MRSSPAVTGRRLKSSAEVKTDEIPDRPTVADAAELRITLLDALGHLNPRDRAIVVLRYWEDHSVQTVAELLGLSPGVVKTQSMRALATLRVLLGDDEAISAPPPEPLVAVQPRATLPPGIAPETG